ncbi:MAG TPA: hypothetical protein VLL52_22715, partial [Anaerolineae bacterium]|nr:hypothetical protein [Anaerolineae bacterium]
MTTNFDWQTDENDAWGEPIVNTTPPPPRRWHPLFLFILLTLLATPFTIFLAYQLTLRRTYNTHQNAVIAVQTYLHDGLNDPERLAPLFLPDDKRWFNDQTDILTANLFLDRHQLGLTWQTANLTPPPTINFNPNYTQATFTLTHQYQTPQQQTITLNQRHTYQRRQGQWYYTNPYPDETWGDWVNLEYDNLLIVTPQRDQEISQRLANNLHTLLLDLCQNEHLNCPHNHQLQIRFDNDTNSLLHLDEYFARLRLRSGFNQFNLKLPTPSLVGLPTDEASYQALYHGYASWIAGVLISNYGDNFLHLQSAEADTLLAAYNLTMPPRPQPAPPNLAPPPILPNHLTLPDQDMLILCAEPPELTLWQYNFSQNKWHLSYQKDIAPGSFQHALYPVPEQNGALFQTTTYNPETQNQQWALFWWQTDAEPIPLLSSPQLLNIMRQSQRYSFIQNDHYFVGFEFIDRDGNNNLYFHWFD